MAVTSKNLKNFLEAKKRETRLIGALERHLMLREPDPRRTDVLHPSEIVKDDWCHKASYHLLRGDKPSTPKEKPNLRLQSIFDEGHTIHAKWQNWFAEMGALYGSWTCDKCASGLRGNLTEHPGCPVHGFNSKFTYAEVSLTSPKHRIAGHTDGWVIGIGEDCLIEIKSIGTGTIRMENPGLFAQNNNDLEAAWRQIRRPFKTHLLQGQMYLRLLHIMEEEGRLTRPAPKEIVFLYELKSNQDYKEFVVEYEPTFTDSIFETALDIVWAVEKERGMDCNIDPVNGCKKCAPFREVTNG